MYVNQGKIEVNECQFKLKIINKESGN